MNLRLKSLNALRQIIRNIWGDFTRKRCQGLAAEVGFWSFYSIFPLITFIVAVSSMLPFADSPDRVLAAANRLLPFNVHDIVRPLVKRILEQPNYLLATTTLLLSLWAASRAVSTLMAALSEIYGVKETRSFWKIKAIALIMVLILTCIYVLAFTFLVVGPLVIEHLIKYIGLAQTYLPLLKVLRLVVVTAALLLGLCVIYALAPNMRRGAKKILPGAMVAATGWLAVSWGFGYYLANIASVSRIYGTLGAVIVMLTWLYLIGLLILIGGVVNKEMMHREST
ncbi:MAG: YihY/virulence factor BrkB family protein [Syntrophobacteraceae bacterium]